MEIVVIILLTLLLLAVLWLVFATGQRTRDSVSISSDLNTLRTELQNTLTENLKLVNSQLSSATGQMNNRMDSASRAVGEVRQTLGELSKATEQVREIGRSISGLEEVLRAPKLRGGLGELLLSDLLGQCLPSQCYELQYNFRSGARVDAVIRLKDGVVPIDSKFPLENFRRLTESSTEDERKAARRRFISDCRRHVDAIASSYIRPDEGTFDFALMYIPAENVYYETIVKDDLSGEEKTLSAYAFSKKVVPVSPNSFYAYLQTVLIGLRGLEISEKAEHILRHLSTLKNEFGKVSSDIDTLGRHVTNAKAKSDELQRKADAFSERLSLVGEEEAMHKGLSGKEGG